MIYNNKIKDIYRCNELVVIWGSNLLSSAVK